MKLPKRIGVVALSVALLVQPDIAIAGTQTPPGPADARLSAVSGPHVAHMRSQMGVKSSGVARNSVVVAKVSDGASASRAATSVGAAVKGLGAAVRSYDERLGLVTIEVPAGNAKVAAAAAAKAWGVGSAVIETPYALRGVVSDTRFDGYQAPYLKPLGIERAWSRSKGAGALVAVVDSGLDALHPDLDAKIAGRYDAVYGGNYIRDTDGHGTFVAGVAAAETNNSRGVAGVGRDARVLVAKVDDNAGYIYADAVARGIVWAADKGADVINLSLGSTYPSPLVAGAVQYARGKGSVVVAAAGNEGDAGNPVNYPAGFEGVIAVGATDGNSRASFSSYGSWVDVAAPGVRIQSTLPGGTYGSGSGTSFSTPIVAGQVALMRSVRQSASESTIRRLVISSGTGVAASGLGTGRVSVSDSLDRLLGTVPSAPQQPSAAPGATSATVKWGAPAKSYGSSVSGYEIHYKRSTSTVWAKTSASASARSKTVGSLVTGGTYQFRIRAKNASGWGPLTTAVAVVAGQPSQVRSLVAAPLDRAVKLSWTAPASTGGLTIAGYNVEIQQPNGTWVRSRTTGTSLTLGGLLNGTRYAVRVGAYNAKVAGPFMYVTGVPATVPGAPRNPAATSSASGQIGLSWVAPASNGGSAVLGYRITYRSLADGIWKSLDRPVTLSGSVSGLSNGVTYELRVSARNVRGFGPASPSVLIKPFGVPAAPGGVSAQPTAPGAVTVNWSAPAGDGGSPVTGYRATVSTWDPWAGEWGDGAWVLSSESNLDATARSLVVEGLEPGVEYRFGVQARNARGLSATPTVTQFAFAEPEAPTVSATGGTGGITIELGVWSDATPATGFEAEYRPWGSSDPWTRVELVGTSGVVSGLAPGWYEVRGRTLSVVGPSPWASDQAEVIA